MNTHNEWIKHDGKSCIKEGVLVEVKRRDGFIFSYITFDKLPCMKSWLWPRANSKSKYDVIEYRLAEQPSNAETPSRIDTDKPSYDELQAMYAGQCQLTDDYAERLKEKSDATLLNKIKELEEIIAKLNVRIMKNNFNALSASPVPVTPSSWDNFEMSAGGTAKEMRASADALRESAAVEIKLLTTNTPSDEAPELYLAKSLINSTYATSKKESEAKLYLAQSGLKNDGIESIESIVIPLYTHPHSLMVDELVKALER